MLGGMSNASSAARATRPFHGPQVVRGAFVLALFGWGIGFYGPPVYLHAVVARTGWSLAWVSGAVTVHFLFGALVVARLPRWHARFGVGPVSVAGACVATAGVVGWAVCQAPWQLMVAALFSGAGWVAMGAVAINAAIAPWFERTRPAALAKAYNGASIGGVVFSPLWVALIAAVGFAGAALAVGLATIAVVALLARSVFAATPDGLQQRADGDAAASETATAVAATPTMAALPGRQLWRDRAFRSLALGMALGLFAQVGLLAHLFALLVPVLGAQPAGWLMGLATACAIGGRHLAARALPTHADRRRVAALGYGVQVVGTLLLWAADGSNRVPIVLAVALFGSGIGNATSLPPLIAQAEFARADVPRVVALIVATAQATYAFAPALLGLLLVATGGAAARVGQGTGALLAAVAGVQLLAMACFVLGRRRNG